MYNPGRVHIETETSMLSVFHMTLGMGKTEMNVTYSLTKKQGEDIKGTPQHWLLRCIEHQMQKPGSWTLK